MSFLQQALQPHNYLPSPYRIFPLSFVPKVLQAKLEFFTIILVPFLLLMGHTTYMTLLQLPLRVASTSCSFVCLWCVLYVCSSLCMSSCVCVHACVFHALCNICDSMLIPYECPTSWDMGVNATCMTFASAFH